MLQGATPYLAQRKAQYNLVPICMPLCPVLLAILMCLALQAVLYRCRKCRRTLAGGRNVLLVEEVGAGHRLFRVKRSHQKAAATQSRSDAHTGERGTHSACRHYPPALLAL